MSKRRKLEDISQHKADGYEKDMNTALAKFNEFLRYQHKENPEEHPFEHISEINDRSYITQTLIGCYADYLITISSIDSFQSAHTYMSKLKVYLKMPEVFEADWNSRLRRNIEKRYREISIETGNPLTKHATTMSESEYTALCTETFNQNSIFGIINRAYLIFQWQCFGRVSEVNDLRYQHVDYYEGTNGICLKLNFSRIKTHVDRDMLIIPHKTSYYTCPYHALACLIACVGSTEMLFSGVTENNEASYINTLLKGLKEDINSSTKNNIQIRDGMTSHSLRRGPAQYAIDISGVDYSWSNNTVIEKKPPVSCDSLPVWVRKITDLSLIGHEEFNKFMEANTPTQQRRSNPGFYGIERKLKQIPHQNFPSNTVIDHNFNKYWW